MAKRTREEFPGFVLVNIPLTLDAVSAYEGICRRWLKRRITHLKREGTLERLLHSTDPRYVRLRQKLPLEVLKEMRDAK
jgi:hypothetical protein